MNDNEKAAIALLDEVLDNLVRVKEGVEPLEEAIQKAAKARESIFLESYDLATLESSGNVPVGLSAKDRRRYLLIRSLAQLYIGLVKDAGGEDFVKESKILRAASEELHSFEEENNGVRQDPEEVEKPAPK